MGVFGQTSARAGCRRGSGRTSPTNSLPVCRPRRAAHIATGPTARPARPQAASRGHTRQGGAARRRAASATRSKSAALSFEARGAALPDTPRAPCLPAAASPARAPCLVCCRHAAVRPSAASQGAATTVAPARAAAPPAPAASGFLKSGLSRLQPTATLVAELRCTIDTLRAAAQAPGSAELGQQTAAAPALHGLLARAGEHGAGRAELCASAGRQGARAP